MLNQNGKNVVPKSVEQSEIEQFATVFLKADWPRFKEVAEIYLEEATRLKKSRIRVRRELQLLARNIRKRLFIGLGVELLLKAVYLKRGFGINRRPGKDELYCLASLTPESESKPDANKTFSLDFLIKNLSKAIDLTDQNYVQDGLKLARVFRNKEGHVVTLTHKYIPETYRAIEGALVELYKDAFSERLEVRFSIGKESAVWRTSPI